MTIAHVSGVSDVADHRLWRALSVILAVCLAVGWWISVLPLASDIHRHVSTDGFSANRAARYLSSIAGHPHPVGSPEHERVLSYLLAETTALGLDPQTEGSTFLEERTGDYRAADLTNVTFQVPGSDSSGAVLLIAHYDSVIASFGAGDDGAAVAALIETARVIHDGPKLKNDVIFLLSDGEELGSLGAKTFLRHSSLVKNVRVVLNFDARGTDGPSMMFETGSKSDWLVHELVRSTPYPYENSLLPSIYRLLPNDTDFSDFKRAGFAGMNFAFAGRGTDYHSALDSLGRLSTVSMEHDGSYALSLIRSLGNTDLGRQHTDGSEVYFNFLGKHILIYSVPTAWLLAACCWVGSAYALRPMHHRNSIAIAGVLVGIAAIVVSTVVAAAVSYGLITLLSLEAGNLRSVFDNKLYVAALTAVSLTAASTCLLWPFRGRQGGNLQAAALIIWSVLEFATLLFCTGASYIFVWPLLAALVTAIVNRQTEWLPEAVCQSARLLCMIPACVLLAEVSSLMYTAFYADLSFVPSATLALFVSIILPQWVEVLTRKWWILPSVSAGAACLLAAILAVPRAYDRGWPRADSILYLLDSDRGVAAWASPDSSVDSWTRQVLGSDYRLLKLTDFSSWYFEDSLVLRAPAKVSGEASGSVSVKVICDEKLDGKRKLSLLVTAHNEVPLVALRIIAGARIRSATLEHVGSSQRDAVELENRSKTTEYPSNELRLRYFNLPKNGVTLTIDTESVDRVMVSLISESYSLPTDAGVRVNARPASTIEHPGIGDKTIVCRSYIL